MPKKKENNHLVWGLIVSLAIGTCALFLPTSTNDRFTKVTDKRMEAVVKITVPHIKHGGVRGAGVLISNRGHVLTAAHLFKREHKTPLVKGLHGTPVFRAEILHTNFKDDIGLIKIDAFTPNYAPLARLGSVRIGEEILTIGHPLSFLDWSVSHGIISQLRNNCLYTQFTQTDVDMNPGNSGGPVFNLKGEVVGIASHGYALSIFPVSSGMNMAVSIDAIHRMLDKFRGL